MSITADQEKAALTNVNSQLLIGGEWREASGGATLDVEDPSTGETIATIADATPEDASAALDAAVSAQAEWAAHPPRERGEILRRAYEALTAKADELALVMTLEMGKPLAESFGLPAWRCESVNDFRDKLEKGLGLDVPSLIVLPIDYSIDVAITHELGTETVTT